MADSVGLALLVVLETLAPAERIAFVLHDMFDLPFDEIAPIVGRSRAAARQLASRARRRVQGADKAPDADVTSQQKIVDAFLAASRSGDFEALLAVLDPDVVFRADDAAMRLGDARELRGADAVARAFMGRRSLRARRWSTARSAPWWRPADGCCWCSASRLPTARSPRSTRLPIPTVSASSIFPSSTNGERCRRRLALN